MRIGELRYRILIEQRATELDGIGGSSDVWSELATVWASMKADRGVEDETAGAIKSRVKFTFRIRRLDTVEPDMRVTWNSKVMDIITASPDGVGYTRLECVEAGE
ncbi:MAG: phage head closure protein [Armatimonadota bacterium]